MSLRDVSYSCGQCGFALNLSSSNRLISKIGPRYAKTTRKGILYFLSIDESRFRMVDEVKCGPYFETPKRWGLQRTRTKLLCRKCANIIGYVQVGSSSPFACLDAETLDEQQQQQQQQQPSSSSPASSTFCVRIRALQPEQVLDGEVRKLEGNGYSPRDEADAKHEHGAKSEALPDEEH